MKLRYTVEEIRALNPCAPKWAEFKRAFPRRKTVTVREILDASGPHGLFWLVFNTIAFGDLELKFWQWWEKDSSMITSSHPANDPPPSWSPEDALKWRVERRIGRMIALQMIRAAERRKRAK